MIDPEMEWALVLLLAIAGLAVFAKGARPTYVLLAMLLLAGIVGAMWLRASAPPKAGSPDDPYTAIRPLELRHDGYVSSDACQSCHPAAYATWRHSYHSTMTQAVTPETMLADWDGSEIEIRGDIYRLEQVGDQYWVDMVDPGFDRKRPQDKKLFMKDGAKKRVKRRVVQSTGSHSQQIYWFSTGKGRELLLLPFTWLVPDERFVHYDATMLRRVPPKQATEEWNQTCMRCHSTAGKTRPVAFSDELDTHVVELGISCESCHGPAKAHVELNQNPLRRYTRHFTDSDDPEIVNPKKLSALRSTQVCGQCHVHLEELDPQVAARYPMHGDPFRPGDDLEETRKPHDRPEDVESLTPYQRYVEDAIAWPDGMVRTAGREYHGVVASPCFEGGEYSCLSCHSLHGYADRADQLKPGMDGNQACLQCHPQLEEESALEAHTHHAPSSTGSQCYECHMPHTNYALLTVVRSHQVSSPNVEESVEYGRPNACNLCHLDQSLAWAGEHLEDWYGQELSPEEKEALPRRSAAVDWLLEGDAAQRGLIASAMSRTVAHEISGFQWMPPLLARLLDDEYAATAMIAEDTLRSLPGYEDLPYNDPDTKAKVLARWQATPIEGGLAERVYRKPTGELDDAAVDAAYDRRNRRPVNVSE